MNIYLIKIFLTFGICRLALENICMLLISFNMLLE